MGPRQAPSIHNQRRRHSWHDKLSLLRELYLVRRCRPWRWTRQRGCQCTPECPGSAQLLQSALHPRRAPACTPPAAKTPQAPAHHPTGDVLHAQGITPAHALTPGFHVDSCSILAQVRLLQHNDTPLSHEKLHATYQANARAYRRVHIQDSDGVSSAWLRMQRRLTSNMPSFPGRSPLRNFPKSNLSSCWPTGVRGLACRVCCPLSRLGSVSVLACTESVFFSQLHGSGSLCKSQAECAVIRKVNVRVPWEVRGCVTCKYYIGA